MKIVWKKKFSLPYGVEDTFFNVINEKLITTGGYNGGIKFSYKKNATDKKKKKYIRELKNNCCYFDLINNSGWTEIEKFPGTKVQCGRCVQIDNKVYMYGGYNFVPSSVHLVNNKGKKENYRTIKEGYLLELVDNKWFWSKLPDLPFPLTNFGMTSYENYIYICCGAYNDDKYSQALVDTDDINNNLWRLDINNLDNGWEYICKFPGTKRTNFIFTQINGIIYTIGGIYPKKEWRATQKNRFYNVMDNWKYYIDENRWEKINKNILNTIGNWGYSNDKCVYKNRYIIMLSGHSYERTIDENNNINKNKSFKGIAGFRNHIHIYDIVEEVVTKLSSNIFCRTTSPDFLIHNDKIYLIGGESIPYNFEGENFGNHSDVFAEGIISE